MLKKLEIGISLPSMRSAFKQFLISCFHTLNPGVKFIDNWHINYLIEHLKTTLSKPTKRIIINVPPRSLKSTIISVAWPAWILGNDPSKRIIVASYSQNLSLKHSEDCRFIMMQEWYKKQFPNCKIKVGSNEKRKFVTTENGFRFATSVGGTLIGEGADYLIIDDPQTPQQAESNIQRLKAINWFDRTLSTRLNNKHAGAIILIMQRLHTEDLSGHLLKRNNWTHVCLPITVDKETTYKVGRFSYTRKANELLNARREGIKDIATAKLDLGSYGFNSQYMQQPIDIKGGIIKQIWFKRFDINILNYLNYDHIYQSWDCAAKITDSSDFSVCTTWGVKNNCYHLIDVLRQRFEFPQLKQMLMELWVKFKPEIILIEDKSSGQALLQDAMQNTILPLIGVIPTKDKQLRLLKVTGLIEAGKIALPTHAEWLADYEQEMIKFPNAGHDDMVDATTQFLAWVTEKELALKGTIRRV